MIYKKVLLATIIIAGCCKMPLVKCGPILVDLTVNPNNQQLDSIGYMMLSVSGFKRYSRHDNRATFLELECSISVEDTNSVIMVYDVVSYLIDSNNNQVQKVSTFEKQIGRKSRFAGEFGVEFDYPSDNYPVKVFIDSIGLISKADTSYHSAHVTLLNPQRQD
jgi:hypothetical protein